MKKNLQNIIKIFKHLRLLKVRFGFILKLPILFLFVNSFFEFYYHFFGGEGVLLLFVGFISLPFFVRGEGGRGGDLQ